MKQDPVIIVGICILVFAILFILFGNFKSDDILSIVVGFTGAAVGILIKYIHNKKKKS